MDHFSSPEKENPLLSDDGDEPILASECMSLHELTLVKGEMVKALDNQHQVLVNTGDSDIVFFKSYKDEEQAITLEPKQALLVVAKAKHKWQSQTTSTILQVTVDHLGFENFTYAEVNQFADDLLCATPLISHTDIGICAEWLSESLNYPASYSFVVVEALTRMVLIKLVQYLADVSLRKKSTMLSTHELKSIVSFVKARFGESLTLDDIASHTQMSVSYFSRLFRFAVGMSPVQFLNAFRIEQAKKMLVSADKRSIGDIACSVGFPDQPHFGKMFKKSVGMSPGVYRKTRH